MPSTVYTFILHQNKNRKQAGAELCQAQAQIRFPADAKYNVTVKFEIRFF